MSEHNDGGPAFPRTDFGKVPENGMMTLRTYIATEAMGGADRRRILDCPPDGPDRYGRGFHHRCGASEYARRAD